MRPGIIIAAVVAVVVVIGGILWYNNSTEQARLETQRVEQAEVARQEELAREEALATEEALAAEQAALEAEQAAIEAPAPADEAPLDDDDAIVVGDEITEGTIVVESATDEAVILDPDETATSVEIVGDDQAAAPVVAPDTATTPAGDDAAIVAPAGATEPGTITPEAEALLTPETFDPEAVLALIEEAPQLTDQQRSTLTALTEGAMANPAMVEPAIESIRAALDLPPLD